MLASLGGELNLIADLNQWIELGLAVGPFFLIGVLIASASVLQWSKTEKGGMAFDQSLLKLPLFGNILFLSEMFQLASLLSTLIWSGIGL